MSSVSDQEWTDYKSKFNKNYNAEEDASRRAVYAGTKVKIEAHNKKYESGEVTYQMGINHLADLTPDEYSKRLCGSLAPPKQS
ncbi:protein CTLA-2-beta [Drosophila busckii]|uniref:protein CTLA-2-beta n=1 Tax=Drosophila busckii TaxID=30019 RepID=UPI00083EA8AF|nr:protein CTLA-2-beta [Drosophila busckii]